MDQKRRIFLKQSLTASSVGVAVAAGLLAPQSVVAAWPEKAFTGKTASEGLTGLYGSDATTKSADIVIDAPDIAENGASVPVAITSGLPNVESVAIVAPNNPVPLIAAFTMGQGGVADVAARLKMAKTGEVIAVVKSDGKLFSAAKEVKVTLGGCGG